MMKDIISQQNEEQSALSISFGIRSRNLDPHAITKELGIEPSHTFKRGERSSKRPGAHEHSWGVWAWNTEGKVLSNDMQDHANVLLNVVEPQSKKLTRYLNSPDFKVYIWIDWQSNHLEGGFSLSALTVKRLSLLCNRLDFGFLIKQRQ